MELGEGQAGLLLLVLVSPLILGFESLGTHDHIYIYIYCLSGDNFPIALCIGLEPTRVPVQKSLRSIFQ
jgi:hypothetical protein